MVVGYHGTTFLGNLHFSGGTLGGVGWLTSHDVPLPTTKRCLGCQCHTSVEWFRNLANSPVEGTVCWNPIIYKVFSTIQTVVGNGISEPSTVFQWRTASFRELPDFLKELSVYKPPFLISASPESENSMSPENGRLEDDCFFLGPGHFQGRSVSFRECTPQKMNECQLKRDHFKRNIYWLVVSTHLKNIRQIGSFPQVGGENKNYLKPPPSI